MNLDWNSLSQKIDQFLAANKLPLINSYSAIFMIFDEDVSYQPDICYVFREKVFTKEAFLNEKLQQLPSGICWIHFNLIPGNFENELVISVRISKDAGFSKTAINLSYEPRYRFQFLEKEVC